LPEQARMAIVGLIPKPSPASGDRPIYIFSLIYKLWGAVRYSLAADWDEGFAGHWDDAVKGSCAQSAGMLRSLLDELAADSGVETCSFAGQVVAFGRKGSVPSPAVVL
jgi:hypothetical protein